VGEGRSHINDGKKAGDSSYLFLLGDKCEPNIFVKRDLNVEPMQILNLNHDWFILVLRQGVRGLNLQSGSATVPVYNEFSV